VKSLPIWVGFGIQILQTPVPSLKEELSKEGSKEETASDSFVGRDVPG
jgi:hypothetical protein